MGDLISGMVVDLGRSNTRRMTANEFMKEMGADPNGVQYTPLGLEEDVDSQAGSDFEYYQKGIQQLNGLGLSAAAKGIDVYKPNPNNPQAIALAKYFQKKQTELAGEAISLKTSADVRKQHMLAKQKQDMWVSKLPQGAVEYDDMNIVPTKSLQNAADIEFKTMGAIAVQPRGDEVAVSEANKQIEDMRTSAIARYTQLALEQGLPQEFISQLTDKFNGVPRAMLDHEKAAKLKADMDFRESQIKANRALEVQRYAAARKSGGDSDDPNAEAEWMSELLNNPEVNGTKVDIIGQEFDGGKIVEAQWNNGEIEVLIKDNPKGKGGSKYNMDGTLKEESGDTRKLILNVRNAAKMLSADGSKAFNKIYDKDKKKELDDYGESSDDFLERFNSVGGVPEQPEKQSGGNPRGWNKLFKSIFGSSEEEGEFNDEYPLGGESS